MGTRQKFRLDVRDPMLVILATPLLGYVYPRRKCKRASRISATTWNTGSGMSTGGCPASRVWPTKKVRYPSISCFPPSDVAMVFNLFSSVRSQPLVTLNGSPYHPPPATPCCRPQTRRQIWWDERTRQHRLAPFSFHCHPPRVFPSFTDSSSSTHSQYQLRRRKPGGVGVF